MKLITWLLSLLAVYSEVALGCPIYPLEILNRALLRGPLVTKTSSSPNQWAGLTTISSGSATSTVSTFQVGSDSLLSLNIRAALAAGYITQGQVSAANSAATSVTASTTAVRSGQVIQATMQTETALSSLGQGYSGLRVNSIVDGVSFAISTVNSAQFGTTAAVLNWSIPTAEPKGIKVNTISPGNFFTLGWADGKARPCDVTVMWEVRRGS